jgi:CopG family transcriptional regulator, nickel-responsive regulator
VSLEAIRHMRRKAAKAVPVTVSMPEPMLAELDRLVKEAPYGTRSDAVQAALLGFLSEQRAQRAKAASQLAVLAVCFHRRDERKIANAKHEFGDVIRSMMHTHLEGDDCVEIFVADGPLPRVQALHSALSALRGVHLVRRTQIPPHDGME